MELFFNECSLHGQFGKVEEFESALENLMEIRRTAKRFNRELYCNRNGVNSKVTYELTIPQVINSIEKSKARALMGWLSRTGPYWEDTRGHSEGEYFECKENVVTDTAIGECAFCTFSNRQAQLVSITPSNWEDSPLTVSWHRDEGAISNQVINHISKATLEAELLKAEPPIQSWEQLEQQCRQNYTNLHFSTDAFTYLKGQPFVSTCAQSFIDLMDILSRFKSSHVSTGRTKEGHDLYQDYFTGECARFSDSTDKEKHDFKNEMTFQHPEKKEEKLFVPYHGKVKCQQMRVHFTWPVIADTPLYVLYFGSKITKY